MALLTEKAHVSESYPLLKSSASWVWFLGPWMLRLLSKARPPWEPLGLTTCLAWLSSPVRLWEPSPEYFAHQWPSALCYRLLGWPHWTGQTCPPHKAGMAALVHCLSTHAQPGLQPPFLFGLWSPRLADNVFLDSFFKIVYAPFNVKSKVLIHRLCLSIRDAMRQKGLSQLLFP